MSMWDLAIGKGQTMERECTKTLDDMMLCEPEGYSTMIGTHGMELGYATKKEKVMDLASDEDTRVLDKN